MILQTFYDNLKRVHAQELDSNVAAATLFYDMITLHPFENGNGRLCWLLVAFALQAVGEPFALGMTNGHSKSRQQYLKAELADRYVLTELFACAGDTVLEELTPGTVVAALLWAEERLGRGGLRAWGEPSLMERLRAWFLEHWREVPWSGFVALRESPALVEDLVRDAVRMQRSAKRQRTCGLGPWR
ncbi:hypothetical protein HYH03_018335 [Edaphochlamys debaryana]|uniref:Fido domain-containing protein n=1 Tax=Edaphochlamys debaryana TaxID=47281 RepID=A0A836BN75_9CHLO|nr:hypothetical protein HYH03_018335 [Edaphochlamys debaryana]|eukprot:KAG2482740.1 hypothetical protein HYH03_018335 [Edaphochlamys debaryana]